MSKSQLTHYAIERRITYVVLSIDISAVFQQQLRHLSPAATHGHMKRCLPALYNIKISAKNVSMSANDPIAGIDAGSEL